MKNLKSIAVGMAASLFLFACASSGPRKTLDELASALQNNNPQEFLSCLDMEAYANNTLASITGGNAVFHSLNSISSMLGLGGLDQMINSVIDYRAELRDTLAKGVASGELTLQCQRGGETNCPWVASSLREAVIVEIAPSAAIAKVTTPAKLTSWIALRKSGDKWLVTGQALMEDDARRYAMSGNRPAPDPGAKSI
ncbi:MAG: hypothetical protein K2H64_02810 [Desulfovibrio sp.]|nr:hypothetical protein [Desulfovibrio sp.]